MRKMTKRVLGLILAMVMVVSQFAGAGTTVAAEETTSVTLQDSTFEGDIWNDGIWSIALEAWPEGASVDKFAYADDEWLEPGENQGTTALKVYSPTVQTATVLQSVDIPAGTYKLSTDFMGENASISLVLGDQTSEATVLNGYNKWQDKSEIFTVESDLTDAQVGFSIDITAEKGYGYLDSIEIVAVTGENDGENNEETPVVTPTYDITVTPSETEVEAGSKVSLAASVTKNGESVTNLGDEGLKLYWWDDKWEEGHGDGKELTDSAFTYDENGAGASLTTEVAVSEVGTYYIAAELQNNAGTRVAIVYTTITTTEPEGGIDTFEITVDASALEVKAGEKVSLAATVKKNGEAITSLSNEGLKLWWWTDYYEEHVDGRSDAVYSNYDNNSGKSLTADVTLPSVGTNYIVAELQNANGGVVGSYTTTIKSIHPSTVKASDDNYTIAVAVDNMEPESGDTVKVSAVVTKSDGTEITDLEASGLDIWWWTDSYEEHADGLDDASYSNYDNNSGHSLTADVTLPSVGTYYIVGELKDVNGTDLKAVMTLVTTEPESATIVEGTLNVEKIKNLPEDFIMGMDISSVVSEFASGVTYKDFNGNVINNVTDFCKFLASNGITHIRVRVWNNPFNAAGNGYGGGNCDVATAAKIAEACRAAGLKMLIDFHCSDLWADPAKQQVPKAWEGYSLAKKKEAVYAFISDALVQIDPNRETVAMVQVGNETTGAFVGEDDEANMCVLFNAGADAVHAYNDDVKVVIHVTNPEKGNVTTWAKNLNDNAVDYDILATSYYPYWHGTLENLQSELSYVKETYGKDVMVAETSYAYTLEDSDGHANTVRVGNNDEGTTILQPFTVQGQANAIRNVMNAVNKAGGLGVFYWEPAWITVGDTRGLSGDALDAQIAANQTKWEKYGSGWASSFGGEYDAEDAGKWYGGSAVDNEAMFYPDGTPTQALRVWNYVKTGAYNPYTTVEQIGSTKITITANRTFTLPGTVEVIYNSITKEEAVTWNDAEVKAVNTAVPGTYTITGTVTFTETVNQGTYNGQSTGTAICTIVVKEPNLITDAEDAGFEKGDNFVIEGTGISEIPAADDPYAGEGSLHWWSETATTGIVTYNKAITLEPGKYHFEMLTQGFAGDLVRVQVLDTAKNVLFKGEDAELEGWKVWKMPQVEFEVESTMDILLQVVVTMQDDGWGTADELYLYEIVKIAEPTPDPVPTPDPTPEYAPSITPDNNTEGTSDKKPVATTETKLKKDKKAREEIISVDGVKHRVLISLQMPGVELKGAELILPEGTDFDILHVEKDTVEYEKAEEAVAKYIPDNKGFAVFEMNLYDEDGVQIHALNGYVTVTVPMPEDLAIGENQQLVVYRLEDDGTFTRCETVLEDEFVVFTTNHFSTYVFVVENMNTEDVEISETVEKTEADETVETEAEMEEVSAEVNAGGNIPVGAVLLAVIVFLAFIGLYVFAKQRKMIK